ncbi:origin recognition complex subunit 2-domain-containing protein [Aspergillus cavernicola]|uniref:Origin recognition complex subunit 2 n=1 Tax=Aspergillus cavernicola TaxID=176166 RepID=A0ABR4HSI8_9EURO
MQPDVDNQLPVSTPKRQRISEANATGEKRTNGDGVLELTPSKRVKRTPQKPHSETPAALKASGLRTPSNRSKAKALFSTPTKENIVSTATKARADRSAKKKSAQLLLEQDEEDIWDGGDRLAEEILAGENDATAPINKQDNGVFETVEEGSVETTMEKTVATPKRRAGRPKGAKNKRSPTPEGELPAHERYFFQNRAGPPRTSNNNLNKVNLLNHEEYFEKHAQRQDPCKREITFLCDLHRRSFSQWDFEFYQGFNICLYGYGSKRTLTQNFADWLYRKHGFSSPPSVVIVNGYTPNVSIRSIFATIVTAVLGADIPSKMGSQPIEVLELLQSVLKSRPSQDPIAVFINSIDAPTFRRAANQALLARLAATPKIHLLATADTPNFLLMWDISLRDQFNFVFHDCTTFAPFDTEFDVVEEVHNLLGRKGRRVGGKEGVEFVLKSLPENARNLYRLLLTELLSMADDDHNAADDDMDAADGGAENGPKDEAGIEFRALYQKASEEFIASSEMMFRTLLKEFHDHQMITSRMDTSGMEILSVPLSRDEMEGVLEDLVLG